MSSDEQAIRDLVAKWHRASAQGDFDTVLSLMSDDVVFLVPGHPPIRGKKEFDALQRKAIGRFRMAAQTDFAEIVVHGDWAHFWCHLSVEMTPLDGSATMRRSGHTLTLLRKQPNGAWVLARDANLLVAD